MEPICISIHNLVSSESKFSQYVLSQLFWISKTFFLVRCFKDIFFWCFSFRNLWFIWKILMNLKDIVIKLYFVKIFTSEEVHEVFGVIKFLNFNTNSVSFIIHNTVKMGIGANKWLYRKFVNLLILRYVLFQLFIPTKLK